MRWRAELRANMVSQAIIITLLAICTLHTCDGVRRPAQRRKDVAPEAGLYVPSPSAESLQAIAQAMGAAGFETYTEGKALVKRLIPADSQPDLDVVEHQGVIGKAGVDFPALPNIPNTGFNCKNVPTGYYADLETDCQVFHICDTSRKISFLCPNGTIFSQSHLICDWWFKVDCASAPALYESSVEYYSNEQKKSQKISASLSKNSDLQQIGTDTNVRAESRRTPVNVPSTTERLLRHRQRLQNDAPPTTAKATSRNFQALFDINPTQRTQATTAFEKRRKNLVQLIANNFGNVPSRTTAPTFDYTTRRTTVPVGDYNSIREMQVAAETASFAQNQNRQYFQDFNNKNYRPYPVYNPNPNLTAKPNKPKSNPTLTTLYDIRDKHLIQYTPEATSKRSTLVPYSKSYTTINSKHEPYTRPGVSLLKDFLEKEKNKSLATTTENLAEVTPRSDILENYEKSSNKVTIESKSNFESVTKIPLTTRNDKFTDTASTDRFDSYSTNQIPELTTEPSYQERRERLMKKLNLDVYEPTQATNEGVLTEKYYGDQPNRPGLIVPPSLTPKTLHSLAIYYATALDNLSTTSPPEENDSTTPAFDEYEPIEDGLPALFSRQTINKYSSLFGQGGDSELLEELRLDPNGTYNELAEDLSVQMSQNPLATSPQIRELAQVFTHALSAYLQDPVQFRKVLSDIRPTHPSFGDMLTATEEPSNTEPTTTVNEDDEEILGFSEDHKTQHHVNSIRDSKALNIGADYTIIDDPTTTARPSITTNPTTTTEIIASYSTTFRTPFRCCGRISASYTTAPPPRAALTTQQPFSYTVPPNVNVQTDNPSVSVTTDNYKFPRFGGFQNNKLTIENTAYGIETTPTESKPLNDYVEVTNLPTAWGVDTSESTVAPSAPAFESKKIRTTTSTFPTTTPVYFTETDSVELENEEELQRAHSQSFIAPNNNSIRQGKQLNVEDKTVVKKPSEDLEAPTLPNDETTTVQTTTTTQPTTTIKDQTESLTTVSPVLSSIFTSPDSEKTTNDFQWPTTYENWQSTFVDPITLNDGLSPSGNEKGLSQIAHQTNTWAFNTATTPTVQYTTTDPVPSSTINIANVEISTPGGHRDDRTGRLLRDPTSTEAAQDFTTISDTVVEKAKEIMGGMNATTTQKLMNVMKKTKSKTVKRLILLLVQTCDDDHNSTAEASKKALLEALMAVSQKDMDEIAQEEGLGDTLTTASDTEIKTTVYQRRMDRIPARESFRRGKSLNVDPKAINSLSNPTTTEALKTEETESTTTLSPRTTIRGRGGKRHQAKPTEAPRTPIDRPFAEARVAPQGADVKTQSDTRAIELLRSLYTIAARWG